MTGHAHQADAGERVFRSPGTGTKRPHELSSLQDILFRYHRACTADLIHAYRVCPAHALCGARERCLKEDMDNYVTKLINVADLAQIILKLLED